MNFDQHINLRQQVYMLVLFVLEAKLRGSAKQFAVIDEMIRTAGFVRNSCVRHWMDNRALSLMALELEPFG